MVRKGSATSGRLKSALVELSEYFTVPWNAGHPPKYEQYAVFLISASMFMMMAWIAKS